ncbi:MAG: DNA polymerase III subunit delta [Candidatus Methylacidiphilaceae bacterium]
MTSLVGKSKAIHFFGGEDEYEAKRVTRLFLEREGLREDPSFESIPGDGQSATEACEQIDRLRESLLSGSLFAQRKVVLWRDVHCLGTKGVGREEKLSASLASLLEVLRGLRSEEVILVVQAGAVDERRQFLRGLREIASVRLFAPLSADRNEDRVLGEVAERMKGRGLSPTAELCERLLAASGGDRQKLDSQIEKLALYQGDGQPPTAEELGLLFSDGSEAVVWDFCDAVVGGSASEALRDLRTLLRQGESEVALLLALAQKIRLAALGLLLWEKGWVRLSGSGRFVKAEVAPEGQAYFPKKKSGAPVSLWQLGRTVAAAKSRPARFWVNALLSLSDANRQMLRGAEKRIGLELALLRLFREKRVLP